MEIDTKGGLEIYDQSHICGMCIWRIPISGEEYPVGGTPVGEVQSEGDRKSVV